MRIILTGFLCFCSLLLFSACEMRSTAKEQNKSLSTNNTIEVKGNLVDDHTRCVHYHSEKDIIAIRMKCCNEYYPCIKCHDEAVDHKTTVWPKAEFDEKAILCGMCYSELTINEYLKSNNRCPNCKAAFNPGCSNHYHLYFDMAKAK